MRDPRIDPRPGDIVAFDGHSPHNIRVLAFTPKGRIRIRTYWNDLAPRNSAVRLDKWRFMCRLATSTHMTTQAEGAG
jgi:hypothetical protein